VDEMYDFGADVPAFRDTADGSFTNLLSQIYSQIHFRQHNWEHVVEALTAALAEYMIAWSGMDAQKKRSPYVETCLKTLIENISNSKFSIKEMLAEIPISQTYFMKLFKKEMSYTPHEYLHIRRMGYAKKLLELKKINNMRVKDISQLCGFEDVYYFSRAFKKHTGKAPNQWTRQE